MAIAGKLITLEGGEGAGKSTQLALLAQHLEAQGSKVLKLREPGGTLLGERLREILKSPQSKLESETEACLFAACRAQLVGEVIRPALAEGKVVLCDRFIDSTVAYQAGGRGLERALMESLNRLACGKLRPDLTVLLDLDPAQGLGRASVRDLGQPDRFEVIQGGFHERVRELYYTLVREEPQRFLVLKANQPPEQIAQLIWHEVQRRFQ
jgi:dTMP kinase